MTLILQPGEKSKIHLSWAPLGILLFATLGNRAKKSNYSILKWTNELKTIGLFSFHFWIQHPLHVHVPIFSKLTLIKSLHCGEICNGRCRVKTEHVGPNFKARFLKSLELWAKNCTTAAVSNRYHWYKFQENLRGWCHDCLCFKWN